MKLLTAAITTILLSACASAIPPGILPGSMTIERSGFDDRQYVRASPGWVSSLKPQKMDALLGGPFKIGAIVHSELGTMLIVRVAEITSITQLEVRIDGITHDLKKYGRTDITTSLDNRYETKNSKGSFHIAPFLLERMVSGDGGVFIRVTTSKGYLEGDFSKSCESRWPDRACIAIRKMLSEARRVGL